MSHGKGLRGLGWCLVAERGRCLAQGKSPEQEGCEEELAASAEVWESGSGPPKPGECLAGCLMVLRTSSFQKMCPVAFLSRVVWAEPWGKDVCSFPARLFWAAAL